MPSATLNQVLELAEELPADEKEMLLDVLRCRQAEAWRKGLIRHALKAERDLRAGLLKPIPTSQLNAYLGQFRQKTERRPPARRAAATTASCCRRPRWT
ncbi:MAG TPA: hypothetical protein PKE47_16490, partial [Verrucomicrobiota bacterium]|nr:hypothetical protein [Verrucomicrobiota bacterium]